MAKWNTGPKNGLWKGGRSVASNGYVLVRVGAEHHLSDVRGYAYEHRLVAESKLGRRLLPGEQVHHIDNNKLNNDPTNLEVVAGAAEHRLRHRKAERGLRMPGQVNPRIVCECGCKTPLHRFDGAGRPRRFVSGHNPMDAPVAAELLGILQCEPLSRQTIARAVGRPANTVAVGLSRLKRQGLAMNDGRGRWWKQTGAER